MLNIIKEMATEFKFPDVGEGIQEGTVVKWLVKVGDTVKEDQKIVQIETDKAVVDLPSPTAGKILKINKQEGDVVKVGESLVTIGRANEKAPTEKPISTKKPSPKKALAKKKGNSVVGQLEEAPETEEEVETKPQSTISRGPNQSQKILAAPIVRKLAAEKNIDLSKIKGTGPQSNITMKDLNLPAGETPASEIPEQKITVKKKYDDFGYIERVPLIGIRKTIADNMVKSTQIPQVTLTEDINLSRLLKIKDKEKPALLKKKIKLTLLPFIVKATIAALKQHPLLNASLVESEILIKKYVNMGIAVETQVGLMVPVIKIAQDKTIPQIAKEIETLAIKAKERKLDVMDLKGGTFTITNYGSIGGVYGTPIINPGESAILGTGRAFDRLIMQKNKIKKIKVLPISLTFDHRILDGAEAARFVETLKKFIEDPDHLLLEMK